MAKDGQSGGAVGLSMKAPDLLQELLRRRDADQRARSAIPQGGREAFQRAIAIDDDNAAWLKNVIETAGWPGRSRVGEDGSHAAWLLAQHADRRPGLQRRCLKLLEAAVAAGDASPADLAHLTDRVLLASGESQIYGTQFTAQGDRYVACRLRDVAGINERRASAGLGTLEESLNRALEIYGPPAPAHMLCPNCSREIEVWLPEMGATSSVSCPECRTVLTLRPLVTDQRD